MSRECRLRSITNQYALSTTILSCTSINDVCASVWERAVRYQVRNLENVRDRPIMQILFEELD